MLWQTRSLLFVVGAGVVVLASAGLRPVPVQSQQGAQLEQPDGWVAFSASIAHRTAGRADSHGRFFRGTDGSTCAIMGSPAEPESILTNDVSHRLAYRYVAGKRTWLRQPLGIPTSMDYRPRRYRSTLPGLSERAGGYEGMRAYDLATRQSTKVLVPALNFFAVRTVGPDWSNEYSDIVIGAVLPPECWPAADASITDSTTPGGIVIGDRRPNR